MGCLAKQFTQLDVIMNTPNFLVLLTIFLSLFLHFPPRANAESQLIKDICVEAVNTTVCTNILDSDPRSATATDVLTIYKVVLELASAHAQKSLSAAQHAFASNAVAELKKPLETCVNGYNLTINLLRSASQEVKDGDRMAATYDSKLSGDSYKECQQAFPGAGDQVNDVEISKNNKLGQQFAWFFSSLQKFI